MARILIGSLLLAAVAACNSTPTSACVEFYTQSCTCPNGVVSTETCQQDGTLGPCACQQSNGSANGSAASSGSNGSTGAPGGSSSGGIASTGSDNNGGSTTGGHHHGTSSGGESSGGSTGGGASTGGAATTGTPSGGGSTSAGASSGGVSSGASSSAGSSGGAGSGGGVSTGGGNGSTGGVGSSSGGSSGAATTGGSSGGTTGPSTATLAGDGTAAFKDGAGSVALLSGPVGIAVDSFGDIYVADQGNNRIRELTPLSDGGYLVATIAGDGTAAVVNGAADSGAELDGPSGLALDGLGDIYVSDENGHSIRLIDSSGNVSTLAGTGSSGFQDGPGSIALFDQPRGLALDGLGDVFVADYGNQRVRELTPIGDGGYLVSTFAGDGDAGYLNLQGTAAELDGPSGLAFDAAGNLYVADTGNNRLRAIDASGNVTLFAGSGAPGSADGTGAAATFDAPQGICFDVTSGAFYVADTGSNVIRQVSGTAAVGTLAGSGAPGLVNGTLGLGGTAEFNGPRGVAVDGQGNVDAADTGSDAVRQIP